LSSIGWGKILKHIRNSVAALVALLAAASAPAQEPTPAPAPAAAHASPAPITLATFARLPFVRLAALSPEGDRMAGLFGIHGRQVIAVAPLFGEQGPRIFALPEGLEVQEIRWVNTDNVIVNVSALRPVENDRWYLSRVIAINLTSGKATPLLWDLGGQNAGDVLWIPSDGSSEILLAGQSSIYLGTDFWPAVYRVNVETGRSTQIVPPRQTIMDWSADDRGNVRTGLGYVDNRRTFRLLYREGGSGSFRTIDRADARKGEALMRPFLFLPGTNHALVVHDDKDGRSGIYEIDLMTQEDVRTVYTVSEGDAEVDYPLLSGDRATLLGVATTRADGQIHWIDPALAELQANFAKAVPDKKVRITSFSRDRNRMLVVIDDADMPGQLYYYDRAEGVLHRIAAFNEDVGSRRLAPVRMVRYMARDGLAIEGVLTLPKDATPNGLPFIVMPHGGPWAQDTLEYDYWAQFLAHLGYAVLQPNFRGSTGYGTAFLRKGEGQMGLAMQDDVTDGVRWAIKEGIADPKRICIVGASYGGYAAMWGIVKDPDLYRCAISIAGVANLRREVNDFGGTMMGGKFQDDWSRMTPDFAAVSPYNFVESIKVPLLLIHGKKDVTVDVGQSAAMFARMQKAGKTVEYVPLPMADHYFTREADRTTLLTAMAAFLDEHNPAGGAKGTE